MSSLGGIWRNRPRARKSGRREAFGVMGTALSSLLWRESLSWKVGEGWRALGVVLLGGSEKERDFDGVLIGEFISGGGCMAVIVSIVQLRSAERFAYMSMKRASVALSS